MTVNPIKIFNSKLLQRFFIKFKIFEVTTPLTIYFFNNRKLPNKQAQFVTSLSYVFLTCLKIFITDYFLMNSTLLKLKRSKKNDFVQIRFQLIFIRF